MRPEQPAEATDRDGDREDSSETAWRLRRLPRSILKDEGEEWSVADAGSNEEEPRWSSSVTAMVPIAFFADLPPGTPLAVADVPLLFETGREAQFAKVIVAACPRDVQVSRVMVRDRLSQEDAERRINAQLPIEQKVERADFVIQTNGSYDETNTQVDALLAHLRG